MKSIEYFEKRNNDKLKKELEELENQRRMLRQGGLNIMNDLSFSPTKIDDSPYKPLAKSPVMNTKLHGGVLKLKGKNSIDSAYS